MFRLLIFTCLLFGCFVAHAQTKTPPESTTQPTDLANPAPAGLTADDIAKLLPQLTPKSPTASALSRYGEYPVSLYTGLPTIEIPIYEFKIGEMTIPIKLTYHAAGNKVNQVADWTGLGWSLQTGGIVTRSVLGTADEQSVGSLGTTIKDPYEYYQTQCLTVDTEYRFGQLADKAWDGQRDLFSYRLPTGTNTFILTPAGAQMLSPNKVNVATDAGINQFTITDESGTVFRFGFGERTSGVNYGYTSAWYLTELISATNSDRATYVYNSYTPTQYPSNLVDTQIVNSSLSEYGGASGVQTGIVNTDSRNYSAVVTNLLPAQINFPGGFIRFVLDQTDRQDGGKSLDKIEIGAYSLLLNQFTIIRTFDFQYSYKNRANGAPTLFLDAVKLLQSDGAAIGQYSFGYNTTPLPAVDSRSQDYWGYYNGQNNTTLIPRQIIPFIGRTDVPETQLVIGGAIRDPNETLMSAWILNRITYPTGGYTEFDFESNRYNDAGTIRRAGGLRIRQMRSYTAANQLATMKTYRYGGAELGWGTYRVNTMPTYSTVQRQTYTTSDNPNGITYNYYTTSYSSTPTSPLNPNEGSPVTYSVVAEYADNGTGSIGKTIYQYRDAAFDNVLRIPTGGQSFVQSRHWDRGQLVSKQMIDAGGQVRYREEYDYQTLISGQLSDLTGLLVVRSRRELGPKSISSNGCYLIGNEYNQYLRYFFSYGLTKPIRSRAYLYADDNSGRYTLKTTETDYSPSFYLPTETRTTAEGNIVLGSKISYPQNFNLPTSFTATELFGIQALQQRNAYLPVETVNFRQETPGATKSTKTGKLTTYNTFTINGLVTALPYQVYLAETDFNNTIAAYVPSPTDPYKSTADWYNSQTGNKASFPIDRIWQPRLTMTSYDPNGNLLGYNLTAGASTSLSYIGYTPTNGVPFWVVKTETKNVGQPSAQTSVFNYQIPLLGVGDTVAPNNVKTNYEYDSFGRLTRIKDKDGNVLKQFLYHYSTAP
jgi:YD repeat-containing protein